jgi:hypothetical protein
MENSRKLLVVLLLTLVNSNVGAQVFTLMKNIWGHFGTQGVSSSSNSPYYKLAAASWADNSGKLWLFGGQGAGGAPLSPTNDLWRYDPSNNEWTFMKGDTITMVAPVYGTMGIASPGNKPGTGGSFGAAWKSPAGDLWLYGNGGGVMWKYEISSGNWTWMSGTPGGNQPPVYGTPGVFSPTVHPGTRQGPIAWTDSSGMFWLYGDQIREDFWKYDPAIGQWAWMGGPTATLTAPVYGTLGVPSSTISPGSRYGVRGAADASGNLYLFGGQTTGGTFPVVHMRNDLWKYNITTGQWTWITGTSQVNQNGLYGTSGVPSATNMPGSRQNHEMWVRSNGDIWLFAGHGYDETVTTFTPPYFPHLNDLWRFRPSTGEWTWMKGSKIKDNPGSNGTLTVPSSSNLPYSRAWFTTWQAQNGSVWIYSGWPYNQYYYSDLWRLDFCTVGISSSSQNGFVCAGSQVTLTASGATSYSWNTGATGPVIVSTPTGVVNFSVTGTSTNSCSDKASLSLTVAPNPTVQVSGATLICAGDSATLTASGASTYTWNHGASAPVTTVSPAFTTFYIVHGSDSLGCRNSAGFLLNVMDCTVGMEEDASAIDFHISPNPNSGEFTLVSDIDSGGSRLVIYDLTGKIVLTLKMEKNQTLVRSHLEKGMYFCRIVGSGGTMKTRKLVVE